MAAKRKTTNKKKNQKGATPAKQGRKHAHVPAPTETAEEDRADLLDINEALDLLKTSRPTLYRWLREGRLRGIKVGRQWRFTREDLERFLHGEAPKVERADDFAPLIESLSARLADAGSDINPPDPGSKLTPPQIVFTRMVLLAQQLRASDIHLEFFQDRARKRYDQARLRYRVDGILHEIAVFDSRLVKPIIDHWKTLGACNVQLTNVPQDCRIMLGINGRDVDLRVSFVPTVNGEIMTARLLDKDTAAMNLDRIPFRDGHRAIVERDLQAQHGILVCTGPVGSGKTTTLYAMLRHLNTPERKLMTVEDPVEYMLDGINQVPVRQQHGMTYARALRSMLRSDPDVLLVGEIRDCETAEVAIQAALTGHLVLTNMHTNDASAALMRLIDMGVAPFLVGDAVRLVIAQRLLRKLCPECAKPATPDDAQLEIASRRVRAGGMDWAALPKQWKRADGCSACRGLGYRGRTAAHELLEMNSAIRQALLQDPDHERVRALAITDGLTSLAAEAIRLAGNGQTSLDEALRVLPEG